MNPRFAVLIAGCMLAGAAAAAYHRAESWPAAARAGAAELPPPLFMQAATGAPTTTAWPPSAPVAFYDKMFVQLPAATAPQPQPLRVAAIETGAEPAPPNGGSEPTPPRAGVTPPAANSDTVEVVIRDRFGRPIRVERIDRRLLGGTRGYPTPPFRVHGPYPYGPLGAYWPQRGFF